MVTKTSKVSKVRNTVNMTPWDHHVDRREKKKGACSDPSRRSMIVWLLAFWARSCRARYACGGSKHNVVLLYLYVPYPGLDVIGSQVEKELGCFRQVLPPNTKPFYFTKRVYSMAY